MSLISIVINNINNMTLFILKNYPKIYTILKTPNSVDYLSFIHSLVDDLIFISAC